MPWFDVMLIVLAGFAGGFTNAFAGGGALFTFPAFLAIGLPPIAANATSAMTVFLGSASSAVAGWQRIRPALRRLVPMIVLSAIGGTIGASILIRTDEHHFQSLVPWLLLAATLIFALGPKIQRLGRRTANTSGPNQKVGYAVQSAVSVYGGYFGAGMGILMLATLPVTEGTDYRWLNALKNLLSIVLQGCSVAYFLAHGHVYGGWALLAAATSVLGGWVGARWADSFPEQIVRTMVTIFGLIVTGYLFFAR